MSAKFLKTTSDLKKPMFFNVQNIAYITQGDNGKTIVQLNIPSLNDASNLAHYTVDMPYEDVIKEIEKKEPE
jgi:hypothetical protein